MGAKWIGLVFGFLFRKKVEKVAALAPLVTIAPVVIERKEYNTKRIKDLSRRKERSQGRNWDKWRG